MLTILRIVLATLQIKAHGDVSDSTSGPYWTSDAFYINFRFGAEMIPTEEIKQGYKQHAALAQLHRWYLLYEEPEYGIENALDILTDDIRVKSGLGEAKGHEQYSERVKQLPTTWKNAHDVQTPSIIINDDGSIQLTTDITYLNKGLLEDGSVRSAELTYTMSLSPSDSVLPKFTDIEISQNSDGIADTFVPRYAQNRLWSLVHYWLAIIEDPARNADPVEEILTTNFSLNFSSGAITDIEGFREWLAGPGSQVTASTHRVSNFTYELLGENRYGVKMDFDWNGILPDSTEMTAKTRHSWTVVDNRTERFARIQSIDVEVLEPFTPKP